MHGLRFPENFIWGTATSAHQVEGKNFNNDWWAWEQAGKNRPSGLACDQYHLFEKDFDLAKKMHNNAHRLSVEWSRIEPEQGKWDQKEIEHYRQVFQALKKRNLKIMLTLHHFTNPQWLAKIGGWENRKSPEYFAEFVKLVVKEFSDKIDFWININEPMIFAMQGYARAVFPPGKKSKLSFYRVLKNLIKAHHLAYNIIHQDQSDAQVGLAQNVVYFSLWPKETFLGRIVLKTINQYWNHWFLKKNYKYLDFIGLNFYFHFRLKISLNGIRQVSPQETKLPTSNIGWEIDPLAFEKSIEEIKKYNLPIYITENGTATVNEDQRTKYLVSHLQTLYQAINNGAQVKGYFYWSLLDNFEWESGVGPRFGLVKVDFRTQKREITPAGKVYAEICQKNIISCEILELVKEKLD